MNNVTLVGNLTADPELRFTANGAPVANFTVAHTPRTFDKQTSEWRDGDPLFLECSVWRNVAENVAESLRKGARVIVTGKLKSRSYEAKDGGKRTVFELEVEEVGPSLRYATAVLTKSGGGSSGGGRQQGGGQWSQPAAQAQQADPWAAPSRTLTDEPPY